MTGMTGRSAFVAAAEQQRADRLAAGAAARAEANEILAGLFADRPGRTERSLAQTVPCPTCGAAKGMACMTRSRRSVPMASPHEKRLAAAKAQAAASAEQGAAGTQEGGGHGRL